MATIRPSYVVEEVVLDLHDLQTKFELSTNQRKLRMGVVKAIRTQLANGKHFETPMCVNRRPAKKDRIFDGGHRFTSMLQHLTENPGDKVKVELHVYDNLSDEQEKAEYTVVNSGTKQSTNDVIKQYEDDISIFTLMKLGWSEGSKTVQFACNVTAYPQPNGIPFFRLVGAYFAAKQTSFSGGYVGSAFDFVDEAMTLKKADVQVMHAFVTDFQEAFGPVKNNEFLKTTPFTALFRIWMDNKGDIAMHTMVSLFKTRIANNAQARDIGKAGGTGATQVARDMFLLMLNAGRRKDLFQKK